MLRGCVPKKLLVYASKYSHEFEESRGFGWTYGTDPKHDWSTLMTNKNLELQRLVVFRQMCLVGVAALGRFCKVPKVVCFVLSTLGVSQSIWASGDSYLTIKVYMLSFYCRLSSSSVINMANCVFSFGLIDLINLD